MFDVIETRTMGLRDNYCPHHPAGKWGWDWTPIFPALCSSCTSRPVYSQDMIKAVLWGNIFWKCHTGGIRKEGAERQEAAAMQVANATGEVGRG